MDDLLLVYYKKGMGQWRPLPQIHSKPSAKAEHHSAKDGAPQAVPSETNPTAPINQKKRERKERKKPENIVCNEKRLLEPCLFKTICLAETRALHFSVL